MKYLLLMWATALLFVACSAPKQRDWQPQTYDFIADILHSNELNAYWHIEHFPERSPLVIDLPEELVSGGQARLVKFSRPVELTQGPVEGGAVFVIHEVVDTAEHTKLIRFAYPPEGIRGTATFRAQGGLWSLQKIELTEL